jgi:hypothetical protein
MARELADRFSDDTLNAVLPEIPAGGNPAEPRRTIADDY